MALSVRHENCFTRLGQFRKTIDELLGQVSKCYSKYASDLFMKYALLAYLHRIQSREKKYALNLFQFYIKEWP